MTVNQDMDAAPQDVKNLKPFGDDETHTPFISPADKIVNNENNVDKSIKLVEMSTSSPLEQVDNPMESSTKTDDKDQDLVDNNDIPETKSQKTSRDSGIVKDDDNVNGNDSQDDNVNGNDSHLFESSVNSKTSYV
nr:hypothetical protein [Tanacetum cinerariifolium]